MPPTAKNKRSGRSGRPPSRPPRDPRNDSTPPPREEETLRRPSRPISRPVVEALPVKVANLEAELARSREERDAEADDMAAMLVRIADAERATAVALKRADQAETRVHALEALVVELKEWEPPAPPEDPRVPALMADLEREQARVRGLEEVDGALRERNRELEARLAETEAGLDATREKLQNALGAVEMQTGRAVLAERSAADGADALRRALAELETDRTRFVDLESKLARMRRQRAESLEASRRELSEMVEKLQRERAEALASAQQAHADELRTVLQQQAEEANALREDHAQVMDALRGDHAEALEALRRQHASELAASEAKHTADLRELEDRHTHESRALREENAAAKRAAARALEEERSAAARARQQVGTLEARLAAMRERIGQVALQLEELERREEMAASLRARSLEQARSTLSAAEPPPPQDESLAAAPVAHGSSRAARAATAAESGVSASLDDIDLDIAD
jgi:hypothetical protein